MVTTATPRRGPHAGLPGVVILTLEKSHQRMHAPCGDQLIVAATQSPLFGCALSIRTNDTPEPRASPSPSPRFARVTERHGSCGHADMPYTEDRGVHEYREVQPRPHDQKCVAGPQYGVPRQKDGRSMHG